MIGADAALVVLATASGLLWGWNRWSPLIRWRIGHNQRAMKAIVQAYLDQHVGLDSSAARLAAVWHENGELTLRASTLRPAAGGGPLEAIPLAAPDGVNHDDPRLAVLVEQTVKVMEAARVSR